MDIGHSLFDGTAEKCRDQILSNEYADFIYTASELERRISPEWGFCAQPVSRNLAVIHVNRAYLPPLSAEVYDYGAVPKLYGLTDTMSMEAAGILRTRNQPVLSLRGKGVLIGLVDTGIDYRNPAFFDEAGKTRILRIWDQTVQTGRLPEGFLYGSEYTNKEIDEAIRSDNAFTAVPSEDENGHGTFLASVCAGNENEAEGFTGAAPDAYIAAVKLKPAKQYLRDYYFIPADAVCYQETDLMLGLKYLNDLADSLSLPLVVCITVGSNMGGHIGTLPFSYLIEGYSTKANHITVIGTGNEADKRHHYFNTIADMADRKSVEIRVDENVSGFSLELWTDIPNILSISILSPSGENTSRIPFRAGASAEVSFLFERTKVSIDYRLLVEKSTSELVFFRFDAPAPGIWKIIIEPLALADGQFHMWLPVTEFLSGEVYFLEPDPYYTLTNPAAADSPIVVSYYNGNTDALSQSSGRGYTRSRRIKPDIAAPGVDVPGALPGGRFTVRTGASAAAAVTAGAIALMLEWLLNYENVPGIDSYQIKSLLILGAVRPKTMEYPNREWGYGQLNLYNTFETIRQL